jgi:hypothetical protein
LLVSAGSHAFAGDEQRDQHELGAIGDGLAFSLSGVVAALGDHAGNALLRCHVASVRAGGWRVEPLAADD